MTAAAPTISIGCAELPPGMGRGRYFQTLHFLEVAAFFSAQPPSVATVRTWREKSPDDAHFALIASRSLTFPSGPSAGGAARAEAERLGQACAALAAGAVVFRTPATFAPSQAGRDALERFFAEVASAELFADTQRVWQPDGLWQPQEIASEAERLDVIAAIDPLANDPLEEMAEALPQHLARGRVYLRPAGLGRSRRRFDGHELDLLADLVDGSERAWVVFANPDKWHDAQAFARLIGQRAPEQDGGA